MKKFIFLLLFVYTVNNVFTQNNLKNFSADVFAGATIFYGDIPNRIGYTYSGKLNWHITSALCMNADITFGQLKGFDKRNDDYFNNNFIKTMVGGEVYLFNIFQINQISDIFQPYGGISIGGIKSNIKSAGISQTESSKFYKDWTFSYQYVGGLKFKINKFLDFNAKTVIVLSKSDKLDNYQPYVPANRNNDAYTEYEIGMTFHFLKQNKIPIIWDVNKNNSSDEEEFEYNNVYSIDSRIKELELKKFELSNTNNPLNKEPEEIEIIEEEYYEDDIYKCAKKF